MDMHRCMNNTRCLCKYEQSLLATKHGPNLELCVLHEASLKGQMVVDASPLNMPCSQGIIAGARDQAVTCTTMQNHDTARRKMLKTPGCLRAAHATAASATHIARSISASPRLAPSTHCTWPCTCAQPQTAHALPHSSPIAAGLRNLPQHWYCADHAGNASCAPSTTLACAAALRRHRRLCRFCLLRFCCGYKANPLGAPLAEHEPRAW